MLITSPFTGEKFCGECGWGCKGIDALAGYCMRCRANLNAQVEKNTVEYRREVDKFNGRIAKLHLLPCPYKKPGVRWSTAVLTKQEEDRRINYNLSKMLDFLE